MSLWRHLKRGVRVLVRRDAADGELRDELQHYLEQVAAEHRARGLSTAEALRAARLEVGNLTGVRETVRGYGWESIVGTFVADLRVAARRLRTEPGFAAVAVLTLALGIGATTAIFSAVNPILFESLPYPRADRVAMIWEVRSDGGRQDGTFGMYKALTEQSRSFETIAAYKAWQPTMTGADQPERFEGQRVSAQFFDVLGVTPFLGRGFLTAEDRMNAANVVVLGNGVWQRRFGGDPAIVGRTVRLDGESYLVVGVMPKEFENVLAPSADIWAPLQYDMSQGRAWGHHLRLVGRLRPGVTYESSTRELDAIGRAVLTERRPETYAPELAFTVVSLQDDVTRAVRPALLAVLAAVALVLVIACVNVTNLLLARGVHRRGEFALRIALGAGRARLVRQLLTESLLLATLGGAAGILVAMVGVRALVVLSPAGLPRVGAIGVDASALAFALVATALVGIAFGIAPALQVTGRGEGRQLRLASRRVAASGGRARRTLVVVEVSLALILLVGSGLLLRSLTRLFAVPMGFDAPGLLSLQIQTAGARYRDDSTTYRFFDDVLEAVRRVPGVTSAALTSQLPLSGDLDRYGVRFDPEPRDDPGEQLGSFRYAVSPGYVETMRIPLRRGRPFDEHDIAGAPLVALVSESMARRRLPGMDPIGQRLRIGDGALYTVVGVVGDVKQVSLALGESEAVYTTASQWRFADNAMSLVVRARGDVAALAPAIRAAVWSVDRDQPVVRVSMMSDLVAASATERRFALVLFEAFALAALVLAAAGIYGILAGSVAERAREIGVRAALGASRSGILALVLRQGMGLTATGMAIGLLGAAAVTRGLSALLFGVSALDPVTYAGVVLLLAVVALAACAVPAWRAARVDPAVTLRTDS